MKFKDINKVYTEKVSQYMAMGMTINASTMSGSQGEIAHIDMTDGKNIYRILLETFRDEDDKWLEGVRMVEGIADPDDARPNSSSMYETIWNNGLVGKFEERYYRISERNDDNAYFGTREEAEAANAKRHERWKNCDSKRYGADEKDITSSKTVAIAVPRIKKEFGIKTVVKKDVQVVKRTCQGRNDGYSIRYHNKSIRIA